ncbi:response regulator [Thermodesulfobacteriota bacterium]
MKECLALLPQKVWRVIVRADSAFFSADFVEEEEGLKMAAEQHPSLVLMDISLPGMDGLTATAKLKQDPATSSIPVVALTAHAMQGDEERAKEAGYDAYLTKPLHPMILYGTLAEFMEERAGTGKT